MNKYILVPVLFVLASSGFGAIAHAQSKPAQIPGASPSENRTVAGVVTSVQVDRILMTGPAAGANVTYNVLLDANTKIAQGEAPMRLSDIKVGANVSAQGLVDLRTLTMHASRIELPVAGAPAPAPAPAGNPAPAAAAPAKPAPALGFWARLWNALFGWLKR